MYDPYRSSRSWAPEADDADSTLDPSRESALPAPRLWRSRSNRVIAGVLGGLSEKFGWEPLPVRLLYGFMTLISGGLLAVPYFAIWAITRVHGPGRRHLPRLWRSQSDKMIAGVLGGMAERFNVHPGFLRLLFVTLSIFSAGFPGILIYLIRWATPPVVDPRDERYDYP